MLQELTSRISQAAAGITAPTTSTQFEFTSCPLATSKPPSHGCGQAGELQSDPSNSCGQAGELQSDPSHGCGQAEELQSDPSHGCGQAGELQSDPSHGCGQAGKLQSDSSHRELQKGSCTGRHQKWSNVTSEAWFSLAFEQPDNLKNWKAEERPQVCRVRL